MARASCIMNLLLLLLVGAAVAISSAEAQLLQQSGSDDVQVVVMRDAEEEMVSQEQLQVASQDLQVAVADSTHNINKIVDVLLALVRAEVTAQGLDQVALPDFTEKFKKRVGPLKVSGKFEGSNGWAKSLASIQRKGDAVATTSGASLTVEVPLGLEDLKLGYRYKARLGHAKVVGGHVEATVRSNALLLRASVSISPTSCSAAVDSLTLTDLGKIKVKATGLGPLNFLLNKIADWVAKRAHGKIEDAVQTKLRKVIDKAGLSFSCDQL